MPRKFLQKYLPDPTRLREHKHLRFFGERLTDPILWHLNRRSIANAMAFGLFCAMLPIPFHGLIAIALCLMLRGNIPLSFVLVWLVTNPITAVPLWYGAYHLGAKLLGMDDSWKLPVDPTEPAWTTMLAHIGDIYAPMFVGSVVVGAVLALIGWGGTHYVWRVHVQRQWRLRAERRRERDANH